MEFLYFPEDKMEYFPGIIVVLFFCVIAVIVTRMFIKISKREEAKFDEQYGEKMDINRQNKQDE
ncbi:hypothetical protein GCM10008986_29350 [Salinibacillus aidingensis]|uniref:Sporulation protein YhaL n=1 Tax=Salinibacillus aidingensis TaxID=237684 RepID=A0ABN1BMZ8_9BACI